MLNSHVLLIAGFIMVAGGSVADARSPRHHGRHHGQAAGRVLPGYEVPPLAGTVGTPIPTEAARFMGYPYDVPGYRYQGDDACLLRVGGLFGPGPSAGRCPFGLDRAS